MDPTELTTMTIPAYVALATLFSPPMVSTRQSGWVDGRGRKRERHGRTKKNRTAAKAARKARRHGR